MTDFSLLTSIATMAALALVFAWRFRTPLNPPTVHTLSFLATLSIYWGLIQIAEQYALHVDPSQDLSGIARAYLIGSIGFALAWLVPRTRRQYLDIDSSAHSIVQVRHFELVVALEAVALLLVLLVASTVVGVPVVQMLLGATDIWETHALLTDLPPGVLAANTAIVHLLALQFATLLVFRRSARHPAMWLALLLMLIIVGNAWLAKRQLFLLAGFVTTVALLSDRGTQGGKLWRLAGIAFLLGSLWLLFVGIQQVRVGFSADEPFWSELFVATAWPLLNLARVIDEFPPRGELLALLSHLLPHRLLGHGTEEVRDILFEPTASISYVQYAYMDFGYPGIFFAALVFGVATRILSRLAPGTVLGVQARLLVMWVCATAAIYSHPFSLNFFLVPAIGLWLLGKSFGYGTRLRARRDSYLGSGVARL